jgi:hypothetical protein
MLSPPSLCHFRHPLPPQLPSHDEDAPDRGDLVRSDRTPFAAPHLHSPDSSLWQDEDAQARVPAAEYVPALSPPPLRRHTQGYAQPPPVRATSFGPREGLAYRAAAAAGSMGGMERDPDVSFRAETPKGDGAAQTVVSGGWGAAPLCE